jgi:hypothetical protein
MFSVSIFIFIFLLIQYVWYRLVVKRSFSRRKANFSSFLHRFNPEWKWQEGNISALILVGFGTHGITREPRRIEISAIGERRPRLQDLDTFFIEINNNVATGFAEEAGYQPASKETASSLNQGRYTRAKKGVFYFPAPPLHDTPPAPISGRPCLQGDSGVR